MPVHTHRVAVRQHLELLAAKGDITYTFVFSGPFLDYCLEAGHFFDVKGKKANVYDGGVHPFSTSRLSTVGHAVVQIFLKEKETENKTIRFHDIITTQNRLLEIAKKYTPGAEWTLTPVDTRVLEEEAYAALGQDPPDQSQMKNFLARAVFGGVCGSDFQKVDNELLGIKGLTDAELEEYVAGFVKSAA